jgi:hypothetical protein
MNLKYQIEQKKKKSAIMNDFVIDSMYIQELASQVLNAENEIPQTASFQEVCDTLRSLCDQVVSSAITLKGMIPGTVPLNPLPPED